MGLSSRFGSGRGGWNPKAVIAFLAASALSIGLGLLGAYGVIVDVGNWGWLIGALAGAGAYRLLSSRSQPVGGGGIRPLTNPDAP